MNVFTEAFHNRLSTDTALTDLLADYNGNSGVFSGDLVPEDATPPYVLIGEDVSNESFDTKNSFGREIIRYIYCYDNDQGGHSTVDLITERVRMLLHRHKLVITGFENAMLCTASLLSVPYEKGFYGKIVSIRLIAMEV